MITRTVQCHMPLCFLHCNSQTHKASEPGWEAQASSPLGCSVWLLSYEVTVWSGPNSPSPAKALLHVLTHGRRDLYFSSSCRNVFPLLLFKKKKTKRFACHFLFLVEKKPQPWTWQLLNLGTTASHPEHNEGETRHMQAGIAVHQNMILMSKS